MVKIDTEFETAAKEYERFAESLKAYDPAHLSELSGVDARLIRRMSRDGQVAKWTSVQALRRVIRQLAAVAND